MNRRFLSAWFAVFLGWMAGSFLIHGTLLYDEYSRLPNLFRPEAESQRYFPWMLLAHVIMAGAFVWIYSRGSGGYPLAAPGGPLRTRSSTARGGADLSDLLCGSAAPGIAGSAADHL